MVTTLVNYLFSFLGLEVVSVCEGSAKKVGPLSST